MEKVGNIFLDLSLNLDKSAKAKVLNDFKGLTNSISGKLKSGFGSMATSLTNIFKSKLAIGSLIAGITMGIMKTNDTLKKSVDYWDKLITQADSFQLSLRDIQKLQLVSRLGDIPDFDGFLKNIQVFQKSFDELKIGKETEGSTLLKQVGLTGNEDLIFAIKKTIESISKADDSIGNLALQPIFGKINSESKQAFKGGLLGAFDKLEEASAHGEVKFLSQSKGNAVANVGDKFAIMEHNAEVRRAENMHVDEATEQYLATQKLGEEIENSLATIVPLLSQLVIGLKDLLTGNITFKNILHMMSTPVKDTNKINKKEVRIRETN
jgi:hypothetical protein